MRRSTAQMVALAKAHIENLSPDDLASEMQTGSVTLVDIRESEERAEHGTLPGAIHAPRGMLEFHADPTSPYHRPEFDAEARLILVSASGGRSALATETLLAMGYRNVAHLDGGITAWVDQGMSVEDAP